MININKNKNQFTVELNHIKQDLTKTKNIYK